jgi:hypothetical protein
MKYVSELLIIIDTYYGGAFTISLTNETKNVTLTAKDNNQHLISSGSGNDIIIGGDDSDVLNGGTGRDTLLGGLGNDIYLYTNSNESYIDSFDKLVGTFDGSKGDLIKLPSIVGNITVIDLQNIQVSSLSLNTIKINDFLNSNNGITATRFFKNNTTVAIIKTNDDKKYLVIDINGSGDFSVSDMLIDISSSITQSITSSTFITSLENVTSDWLTIDRIPTLTTSEVSDLDFTIISPMKFSLFTPSQIKAVQENQFHQIEIDVFSYINIFQIQALEPQQITYLNTDQLYILFNTQSLTALQIGALTEVQIALIPELSSYLSLEQIQFLKPEIISLLQVYYLTTDQISVLTTDQIEAFTVDQIGAFSPEQIQAITPSQTSKFTETQLGSLTSDQWSCFSQTQIIQFSDNIKSLLSSQGYCIFTPMILLDSSMSDQGGVVNTTAIDITIEHGKRIICSSTQDRLFFNLGDESTLSTVSTSNELLNFTSGEDKIISGNASSENFVKSLSPVDFETLLNNANTALDGTVLYYFGVTSNNDGYLITDDASGNGANNIIRLVGVTDIELTDISY